MASQISPDSPIAYRPNSFAAARTVIVLLAGIGVVIVAVLLSVIMTLVAVHGDVVLIKTNAVITAVGMQGIIDIAVVIFLLLVLPWLADMPLSALGFKPPDARVIGIALLGAIAMIVVVNGTGALIDTLLHTKHQQAAIQLFLAERNMGVKILFAVLAVIVAPIAEEMAFRVFVFNAVRRYQPFLLAALVSGVLFGAAHADKFAFIPLVFGGMILCTVYSRSKNAFASMITHGIFNGVSVALLFVAPNLAK